MHGSGLREDVLVTIGFADAPQTPIERAAFDAMVSALSARFRYWELLIACDLRMRDRMEPLFRGVANLRMLWLAPGTTFYQRREATAAAAIGDIVVLAAPDELRHLDVVGMAERAAAEGAVVIGQHAGNPPLSGAVAALGRGAGLRIATHDMLTAAFPRGLLDIVLRHPDRLLGLRFLPVDPRLPVVLQPCSAAAGIPLFHGGSSTGPRFSRRLHILHRLMVGAAPRVLTLTALIALLATAGALAFSVYSVVAWMVLAHTQPGWLTTSLAIGGTSSFLGLAVFGLSIGLQRLLELVVRADGEIVVDESGTVELFGKVRDELNVEIASGSPAPARVE
jgi:hypothetical protein